MAAKSTSMILMMITAVVLAAYVSPRVEAEISCGTVLTYIRSCLPYVTDKGPIGFCCGGVKGLYEAAKTTPDRQSTCRCLKTLAGSIPSIDLGRAEGLPAKCGVSIPYKISPSTDCAKVRA